MRISLQALATLLVVVLASCTHTAKPKSAAPPAAQKSAPMAKILLRKIPNDKNVVAAETVRSFSYALASVLIERGKIPEYDGWPGALAETAGLETMANYWKENRSREDEYLDSVLAAVEAGFTNEYALRHFSQPGWWISPEMLASLNWEGFQAWAAENLPSDHSPRPYFAYAQENGKSLWRPAPGEDIVFEVRLLKDSCGPRADERKKLLAGWRAESETIVPVTVAAESGQELTRALQMLAEDPKAKEHGVILVSATVARVLFEEAGCRIREKQWAEAERSARELLALAPADGRGFEVLPQALLFQNKHDEAMDLIDRYLDLTGDPCAIGRALTTRSLIYLAQRQPALARATLLQAADFRPDDPIIRSYLAKLEGRGEVSIPSTFQPKQLLHVNGVCREGDSSGGARGGSQAEEDISSASGQ